MQEVEVDVDIGRREGPKGFDEGRKNDKNVDADVDVDVHEDEDEETGEESHEINIEFIDKEE